MSGGGKVAISYEGCLGTHTGAGSDSTGRLLTLMMGVSALSPPRLICGSEVTQDCTLVKTHQKRRKTQHSNKDPSVITPPPSAAPRSDVPAAIDGNCVFSLLMRKDDACWVLGHREQMTEMGKHFCRLKFCGWKTTHFGLLSMMWKESQTRQDTRTHTQNLTA